MKKHLFSFHFIAFSLFLLCACVDWKGSSEVQEKLSWRTASLCIENPIAPGDSLRYQIEFKLDTLADESDLARQLAAVLRDRVLRTSGHATVGEAMAALADSIEMEWKAEIAELYEPESEFMDMFQYYYTIEGSPLEDSNDSILSYMIQMDCYLGGAHGSHEVQYYNFERKSGRLLNIGDIVPASKEMLVLMAMEEQLCKDWGAKDLADLQEQTGITMLGDLFLTNNFLLRGDSIEFLFNQYEIAPYAAGLISVTLKRP